VTLFETNQIKYRYIHGLHIFLPPTRCIVHGVHVLSPISHVQVYILYL